MASLPRRAPLAAAALALGLIFLAAAPPPAKANVACDLGSAPVGTVTGAIGIGNPAGDACNAITDPALGVAEAALDPLKGVAEELGNSVFRQITSWVTGGASWLVGRVVKMIDQTTTPDLRSGGFLRSYRQMALIAVLLAAAMLLFAVLEGIARGDTGMLVRVVVVNVPLAAIATSVAYVLVQTLIGATDSLSHQVALSGSGDTHRFFEGAIKGLGEAGGAASEVAGGATQGPGAGAAIGRASGTAAVPLFVGFIAAAIAAIAAFFVWIELLMRDAAVYVVALFMPMALAASIWPRWSGALRRTAELLAVLVFSKFVIVAIIALAAGLLAEGGGVEHVLAAGALLLLACFSPLVLFKLLPFAEGALAAAYHRPGAAGGAMRGVQVASSAQMMRGTARSNWSAATPLASGTGGGAVRGSAMSGTSGGPAGGRTPGPTASSGASGAGAKGAAGAAGAGGAAGAAATKAAKAATERLTKASPGQAASAAGGEGAPTPRQASAGKAPRPRAKPDTQTNPTPDPSPATGGRTPGGDTQPPRPASEPPAPKRTEGKQP